MSMFLLLAVAICVTYLITPSIRFFALKFSVIDRKSHRKVHTKVVARFGGFAIYLGFIFATCAAFIMDAELGLPHIRMIFHIFAASTLILILGIYDDAKGSNALVKFSVQVLAALFLIHGGIVIRTISNPFGAPIELGIFSVPLTIVWLVGVTNAINLIDGLDGLAAGIVGINAITLAIIYFFSGAWLPASVALALGGACLGFLPYNFYPAKIFMGDTGSLFLGILIAALATMTEQKSTTAIGLLIPIIGLAVPLVDTSLAFTRRILRGDNPFRADKQHIHHWLMRKKLTDKQAVIILWTITAALNLIVLQLYFLT